MIDLDTLAVALTITVLVTAALAGLVGGLAGSAATTWAARRREQRSVAAEAEAVLARHNRRARLWRGRR